MFGYTQVIDIPTRITNDCTSLIDLLYLQNIDSVTLHGVLPRIADHEGIFVTFHCTQDKVFKQKKLIFDYSNIHEEGLINYIKNNDFDNLVFSRPYTEQAGVFTDILIDARSKSVPSKTICIRPTDESWTNTYTRLLLRKKNQNYQLFKRANSKYLSLIVKKHTSKVTV